MHKSASLILGVGVILAAGYAVFAASSWPWKASLFPLAIGIPVLVLAGIEVLWVVLGKTERGETKDFQLSRDLPESEVLKRSAIAGAWIGGFFAAIVLLGFPYAVPLFALLYLKLEGREGWALTVGFTAGLWIFFYALFDRLLHLPFPQGWLLEWSGLS
jgi:hypothetical protein